MKFFSLRTGRSLKTLAGLVLMAGFALSATACKSDEDEPEEDRGTAEVGDPCEETRECVPNSVCFNKYCVGEGTFRVSLGFDVDSDFDLHVETPDGSEIYFGNRIDAHGTLDVDQCVSSCEEEPHAENIVFDNLAAHGTYTVWVRNYDGRNAGAFEIQVRGDGLSEDFSGDLPAAAEDSDEFTFTF